MRFVFEVYVDGDEEDYKELAERIGAEVDTDSPTKLKQFMTDYMNGMLDNEVGFATAALIRFDQ